MAFVSRVGVKDPGAQQDQWERLARRRERLYVEDEQFRITKPDEQVAAAARAPGLRIAEVILGGRVLAVGCGSPVGVIVDPTGDLLSIADHIERQRASDAIRPTHASVHGTSSVEVTAADLTLEKFIDDDVLKTAMTLPQPTSEIRTVLLTGATGFLGRFLGMKWLQVLADSGGTLVCLTRGADAAQARQRIEAALGSDPQLLERFRTLAERHLEVVAGDIGEPNLGLDEATWLRLSETVDLIVHPAAHVNHVLPYHQLFAPNVVGTAEVIRLAITARLKPIHYISTMGVSAVAHQLVDEETDIRRAVPACIVDDSYANGYGISKWAGEVLMREAHDLCGLPIAVFRPGMILADSRYAGQLNVPDIFTRLLFSLVATGTAPRSFYVTNENQRPHYEGLPVDFLADAIAAIGPQHGSSFDTYNTTNPHDDGISLDTFVDWIIAAGYPIEKIDDYSDWLSRFETAMGALPERQRAQSVLTVLTVLEAYRQPMPAVAGSPVPGARFRAGGRKVRACDPPPIEAADREVPSRPRTAWCAVTFSTGPEGTMMSSQTRTLYPSGPIGAPKHRHGHATEFDTGLPAGTEVFSADNHISVADDIFYEHFPDDLKDRGAADLVRGRRILARPARETPWWSAISARCSCNTTIWPVRPPTTSKPASVNSPKTASTRNWHSPTRCWRCSTIPTRTCGNGFSASTTNTSPTCRNARRALLRSRLDQLVGPARRAPHPVELKSLGLKTFLMPHEPGQ